MTKLLFQVNAMQCHESNCEKKCNIEVCENRMNLRCKPKIICYFMPVIDEAVYRDEGSQFHYRSDSILDRMDAVGVCGGTSLDRTDLTLAQHEQEFANLLGRLRHFGFA